MRLRDSITRLRAPLVDAGYGNQRRDWDSATEVELQADVQPLSSDEDVVDQDRTTVRQKLFVGPDADLQPTDRVRHEGVVYEVDGDVESWRVRGRSHHSEAVLVRVKQL